MPEIDFTQAATITLNHYLSLSTGLFCLGMLGVLLRRNVIVMLMSIEIMLNAVNLTFVAFAHYRGDISGNILVFFVMTVAAAEAGVGLALAVAIFKRFKDVNIKLFEQLKG
ncbi:MAG: NADH-quinone oxidoreductase subunit K [Bdellovibrionales bacterium RBG_16_40_8]|nr:MAG: NADH-quinone oxidoreductase subunit K [Bdellovibrionales bacterium RBG_16_40_8]